MVWKDLLVNAHPSPLLIGFQMTHEPLEITDHVFADLRNEFETFLSDENQNLPAVVFGDLAPGIAQALEAVDQARRSRGGVPHALRDFGHREGMILLGE